MIGRKMALISLDTAVAVDVDVSSLPETKKQNAKEYRQDAHTDGLGFLIHLDNAVHECGSP
jgi:hypothetical protein